MRFLNKLDRRTFAPSRADLNRMRIRRLRKRVSHFIRCVVPSSVRAIMITLTYSPDCDYSPNHIRNFMRILFSKYRKRIISYVWVAELQRRGVLHYHVLIFYRGFLRIPYPDKQGWWPWGMSRVEIARSKFYVIKYLSKGCLPYEAEYPKNARIFGIGLWTELRQLLSLSQILDFRLTAYPSWVSWAVHFCGYSRFKYISGLGYLFDDLFLAKGFWIFYRL